jgi:hypothetical protein
MLLEMAGILVAAAPIAAFAPALYAPVKPLERPAQVPLVAPAHADDRPALAPEAAPDSVPKKPVPAEAPPIAPMMAAPPK